MHCLGFGLNEVNRDGNSIWHGFGLKCRSLKLNAAVIQKHVSGEKGARGEATSLQPFHSNFFHSWIKTQDPHRQ
jgi:hypothetical protein